MPYYIVIYKTYEMMYYLNLENQSIDEMEDGTFCIFNPTAGNLYIMNSTSKFILRNLLLNISVENIVDKYIMDNSIDLREVSREQIITDFNAIKDSFLEYNIIVEFENG